MNHRYSFPRAALQFYPPATSQFDQEYPYWAMWLRKMHDFWASRTSSCVEDLAAVEKGDIPGSTQILGNVIVPRQSTVENHDDD
jgi:hypothetical protein